MGRAGAVAALGLFGAVGCSASGATTGELNQGGFSYETVGDGRADVASGLPSSSWSGNAPVPVIAVGGEFKLQFIPNGGSGSSWGSDQIIPAAPGLIARDGANLVAKRPGQSAVLANDGSVVQDFVHVQVKLVDHVVLARTDGGGQQPLGAGDTLSLAAGQSLHLSAIPMSVVGEILAGSLPYAWSLTGDPAVTLGSTGGFATDVLGDKPGKAVVTVNVAGKSAAIGVEVTQ
jgi:hypothetical protein